MATCSHVEGCRQALEDRAGAADPVMPASPAAIEHLSHPTVTSKSCQDFSPTIVQRIFFFLSAAIL